MSYRVLYRKYRPTDFKDLIGQDTMVNILRKSVVNNKISHAYIFSGPRGTGKTSSAKIFAKMVNCLNAKDGNPCNECNNCIGYDNSSDIIEIDAASNNGVDEIREITNNIKLAPNSLKYKVYIIDEVHMLSQSAFNALLLTLEEPPSHVIFILATTNVESVPITILSRCQRFDFKKVTIANIVKVLQKVAQQENINISSEAINEIAYLSDGGLRDSLSLLDQLSKQEAEITLELVTKSVGNVSGQIVNELLMYIESNKCSELIEELNELSSKSVDIKLLIKSLVDAISKSVKHIIENEKESCLSLTDYKNLVFDLTDLINKINVSVDPYVMLEITLLSYIKAKPTKEKNVPEESKTMPVTNKKTVKIKEKPILVKNYDKLIEVRVNNCFVNATKEDKIKNVDKWEEFREIVIPKYKGLILDLNVAIASDNILVLTCDRKNDIDELYENIKEIENYYNGHFKELKKLVFISVEEWQKYSKEYIENMKNGVKYNYIEENVDNDELINIADSIFDSSKIEER